MCGIAGCFTSNGSAESVLDAPLEMLRHRGPDSAGVFRSGPYIGGMRRLAINDLVTGDQPLYNEDHSVALLYNGEIYNYKQLRDELEKKGHTFQSHSDGEVVCHLYEDVGDALFERLDGMFAIALWDAKRERLILARDIPGEKPLYYSKLPNGGLAFASEVRSLVRFPGVSSELNLQAMWDLPTFLWIPEPDTIYRDVRALPPGHFLTCDATGISLKNYPNRFEEELQLDLNDDEALAREVRRVVESSIKSRLLSDVPVGSFLSGGLDSSIIAAIASKNLSQLDTFTIGFEDLDDPYHGKSDESAFASSFAAELGTRHHTLRVTGKTFLDELDDFCRYGDQPWGVSSGLGVLSISKFARELGIKVLLTGDGADECFGGYSWYPNFTSDVPAESRPDGNISFQSVGLSVEERVRALKSYPGPKRAWAWHYYASEQNKRSLFNRDAFAQSGSSIRWFERFKSDAEWSPKDFVTQDQQFYLTNEMLRKADRMTMAHSVEGRPPFVAPGILNLAKRLPFDKLVRGTELKWLLKKAFADVLPEDILRRPKHGFNVPIDHWLKHDWKHLLDETFSPQSQLSKHGLLAADGRKTADAMLADPKTLHGHTLFCYIILNRWLEQNPT